MQEDSEFLQRVGSKKEQGERFRETIHGYGHAERTAGTFKVISFEYSRIVNSDATILLFMLNQKSGRKRKLREEELVNPTDKPVYKWRQERKR